jgi:hypothetical protein
MLGCLRLHDRYFPPSTRICPPSGIFALSPSPPVSLTAPPRFCRMCDTHAASRTRHCTFQLTLTPISLHAPPLPSPPAPQVLDFSSMDQPCRLALRSGGGRGEVSLNATSLTRKAALMRAMQEAVAKVRWGEGEGRGVKEWHRRAVAGGGEEGTRA